MLDQIVVAALMWAPEVAGHGGEAAAHAEPSALGFTPTGWVALAMVAVFALMGWMKVHKAVGAALDDKIAAIRAQLEEAETLRKEAEALKAEYEAKARSADGERQALLTRAQKEAEEIVAKAERDAAALVERRGRMAEDKIAAEERAAVEQLRTTAADAATKAAARLIADKHDAKSDARLVSEAIAGLGNR